MLNSGKGDDMFYDSVDCLSTLEEELDNGFWMNGLKSVKERREAFWRKIDLGDSGDSCAADSLAMASERIAECSGTVSSSICSSVGNETVENPHHYERDENGDANVMVDETQIDLLCGSSTSFEDRNVLVSSKAELDDQGRISLDKKGARYWWKGMANKRRLISTFLSMATKATSKAPRMSKAKVQVKKKRLKELSALYIGQEFQAHKGVVRTAKFSPDGQYLASGAQDGVVRVWLVALSDGHENLFLDHGDSQYGSKGGKTGVRAQKMVHVPVMIPDRVFQIDETPVHEFHGHCGDILDLAWSNSNLIISSSSDNTVRLWHIGSDECLRVYRHPNFVTCVQFNPIDDDYFISGSIDGKVRLWTVSEGRVVDWDDTRDAVTAISYQPDGQGLVVGCLNGSCRFYDARGCSLRLVTHVQLPRSKKSSGNRISGIQFSQDGSQRVILTSQDSKVRIFDKTDLIHKYLGLSKSGSQMSASVTPNGRHIISVGEGSCVYLWDYNYQQAMRAKRTKSIRSCEYFLLQGVSVVVPWSGYAAADEASAPTSSGRTMSCSQAQAHHDPGRVSLANWFSTEGSSNVTATWPEEMLPLQVLQHQEDQDQRETISGSHFYGACSRTWGLVIVTASCDGMIRVFHNYGLLPLKV